MGIKNNIRFTGLVTDPENLFSELDVFLLTSREDPFPLAAIEAGMLGKPILSFKNATGINEITKNKGGFSVPYLSIEAMATKVIEYYKNTDLKQKHGNYNAAAFRDFIPEKVCPDLYKIIVENK